MFLTSHSLYEMYYLSFPPLLCSFLSLAAAPASKALQTDGTLQHCPSELMTCIYYANSCHRGRKNRVRGRDTVRKASKFTLEAKWISTLNSDMLYRLFCLVFFFVHLQGSLIMHWGQFLSDWTDMQIKDRNKIKVLKSNAVLSKYYEHPLYILLYVHHMHTRSCKIWKISDY